MVRGAQRSPDENVVKSGQINGSKQGCEKRVSQTNSKI